jgi:hypothetical protein
VCDPSGDSQRAWISLTTSSRRRPSYWSFQQICVQNRRPPEPMRRFLPPNRLDGLVGHYSSQVHVSLPPMMDLVIDPVEEQPVDRTLPLAERLVDLLEALRRDLRPQRVDLPGYLVPAREELLSCRRFRRLRVVIEIAHHRPLPRGQTPDTGRRHRDHLQRHRRKRAHPADGEPEELILREGLDDAPGYPPVPLPVLQERLVGDDNAGSRSIG